MRTLLLLVLCSGPVLLSSQPVLHSNEMLGPGTTTYMRFLGNLDAVDTTHQGLDVVWDLSGMTPHATQPPFLMSIVDPSTTPQGGSYPTANYAWWEQPNNYYRYFNLTPTLMERVGSFTTSVYQYANPQVEYVFPLTYGTTNTDDWWGVADGGQYRLACVGTGTLIVPGAVLNDVLMVRAMISNSTTTVRMYLWYSSEDGRVLLQYSRHPLGNFGLYYDGLAMGEHERSLFRTTLFGNPVAEQLTFSLGVDAGKITYNIHSVTGANAGHGWIHGNAGSVNSINVSGLRPGVSFFELLKEGTPHRETLRFVKE